MLLSGEARFLRPSGPGFSWWASTRGSPRSRQRSNLRNSHRSALRKNNVRSNLWDSFRSRPLSRLRGNRQRALRSSPRSETSSRRSHLRQRSSRQSLRPSGTRRTRLSSLPLNPRKLAQSGKLGAV